MAQFQAAFAQAQREFGYGTPTHQDVQRWVADPALRARLLDPPPPTPEGAAERERLLDRTFQLAEELAARG